MELRRIAPSDGKDGDYFGSAIAFSGSHLVVGASQSDVAAVDAGAAYVFDPNTGEELMQLIASDAQTQDSFGISVAIDGGVVAVGATGDDDRGTDSGAVYLFDANSGDQLAKLHAPDGAAGAYFGSSVALSGSMLAVSAPADAELGAEAGATYLFAVDTVEFLRKLVADDAAPGDFLGIFVDLDAGVVACGAFGTGDNGPDSGAAYLFDAASGQQLRKLIPREGRPYDLFGAPLVIADGLVTIGCQQCGRGDSHTGAAYRFDVSSGWEMETLLASDGAPNDRFSIGLAVESDMTWIGAPLDDAQAVNSGSVYMFDLACRADFDGNTILDTRDFLAYLQAWASGDLSADWNGDRVVTTQDFIAYLNDWAAGC